MNFDEAKNLFIEKYSDFRFEFSGETDEELWFTHPRFDKQVRLPIEDITEYLAFEVFRG